jgi:hypothetical protein
MDSPSDQFNFNVGILDSNAELEHVKSSLLEGIHHFGTGLV